MIPVTAKRVAAVLAVGAGVLVHHACGGGKEEPPVDLGEPESYRVTLIVHDVAGSNLCENIQIEASVTGRTFEDVPYSARNACDVEFEACEFSKVWSSVEVPSGSMMTIEVRATEAGEELWSLDDTVTPTANMTLCYERPESARDLGHSGCWNEHGCP